MYLSIFNNFQLPYSFLKFAEIMLLIEALYLQLQNTVSQALRNYLKSWKTWPTYTSPFKLPFNFKKGKPVGTIISRTNTTVLRGDLVCQTTDSREWLQLSYSPDLLPALENTPDLDWKMLTDPELYLCWWVSRRNKAHLSQAHKTRF